MRRLDYLEYKMCQMIGDIFVLSLKRSYFSSPIFIKRFMNCKNSSLYFSLAYLFYSSYKEDVIDELNENYTSCEVKVLYSEEELYWMGYFYQALIFLLNISSKRAFKLFPSTILVTYYPLYHTFDIEEAVSRILESISYNEKEKDEKAYELLKKYYIEELYHELLGERIEIKDIEFTNEIGVGKYKKNNIEFNLISLDLNNIYDDYSLEVIALLKSKENQILLLSSNKSRDIKRIKNNELFNNENYKVITK